LHELFLKLLLGGVEGDIQEIEAGMRSWKLLLLSFIRQPHLHGKKKKTTVCKASPFKHTEEKRKARNQTTKSNHLNCCLSKSIGR
jgi:hypothetical protein